MSGGTAPPVVAGAARGRRAAPLLVAASAVAATGVAAAVALALGGYPPLRAFQSMIGGAFGSPTALLSVTLVRSVPLILTGLAIVVAFRAGVWNIGAEGQLYAGAIAAAWAGLGLGALPAPVLVPTVLAAAAAGGAAWALLPALMRRRLGVGEVITTILMNFVALHLTAWLVRGPLQEARGVFPQTDAIAAGARLGALVPGTRLHWGFALAVALALAVGAALRWTRAGFRLRVVGSAPAAARVSGRIDADALSFRAFLASGALAGLAGGVEIAGVTFALYEGLSPGWGYTAIAVALLAGLSPVGVLATGILFGALEGGAGAMQREAGVPSVWVGVVQALVILSVLALDRARRIGTRAA